MQQPIYKGEAMLLRWSDNSTNGRTVTFTIEDGPDATKEHPFKGLSTGKGGQRFAIVAVPLGEAEHPAFEQPISPSAQECIAQGITYPQPKPERPKQSWGDMKRSQQAGILAADERFQRWLGVRDEDDAADYIRSECGLESRRQLDNGMGGKRFDEIVAQFRTATGQMAEQR